MQSCHSVTEKKVSLKSKVIRTFSPGSTAKMRPPQQGEQLPLVANSRSGSGRGRSALEQQLDAYHKQQRARREDERRERRARSVLRASVGFAAAAVATLALLALGWAATRRNGAEASPARLAGIVDAAPRFWGVARVSHNGHKKFERAQGWASAEFAREMDVDAVFPVGSNSKLFVAVALYQLQEAGRVELTDPVNAHLHADDFARFGFPEQTEWCPRVGGHGPCQNVTFVQLMSMASGIGDELNCDNVHGRFCRRSPNDLAIYRGSIAAHVGDFINDPLVFAPGTNYSYANPNFVLLAYLVEKLSGQPFETYLHERIFTPVGLNDTFYDPYDGQLSVHKGWVEEYVKYYYHEDLNATDATTAKANSTIKLASTGTCRPYMNSGASSGAGGIHSTAKDMQHWYVDLFHKRGAKSSVLSQKSIRQILQRRNPVYPVYAQGIRVDFNESDSEWPSRITYCGGMKCATTCMAMSTASANETSLATAFSNSLYATFSSRSAFDKYHPTEMLGAVLGGEDFVVDFDSSRLAQDLLEGYLHYRAKVEAGM